MDGYHEKKVVEQAVGKRGREAENKQRKAIQKRGCSERGVQSAETPASKGEKPNENQ